ITFCNSRTLPGQPCRARALRNPGVSPRNCLLCALANTFRKYSARRGMSSALSRSGGMWIRTTETRKYRSSRKVPFCTISSRFRKGAGGERDKWFVGALAEVVNGPRHHALAGSAFSGDQHAGVNGGNLANHFVHLLHGFAVTEQSLHVHRRKEFLGRG